MNTCVSNIHSDLGTRVMGGWGFMWGGGVGYIRVGGPITYNVSESGVGVGVAMFLVGGGRVDPGVS